MWQEYIARNLVDDALRRFMRFMLLRDLAYLIIKPFVGSSVAPLRRRRFRALRSMDEHEVETAIRTHPA